MSILDRSESRQGATVRLLAVHSTEGNGTAQQLRDAAWWEGSSHAIDDESGTLLTPAEGCVPFERASWTIRSANRISENIEQVGWAHWTRAEWLARPKLLDATARWLAERSKARNIPLVKLSPAEINAGKWGVIGHGDWTEATRLRGAQDGTHTDPGPNYPWDVVIDKAREYAAGETKEWWEMPIPQEDIEKIAQRVRQVIADATLPYGLDNLRRRLESLQAKLLVADANDQPDSLATAIVDRLPAVSASGGGVSREDVKAAIREVLGSLDAPAA